MTPLLLPPTAGQQVVTDLKNRAQALGVPMCRVLEIAHVDRATFYRWARSKDGPRVSTYFRILNALREIEAGKAIL